MPLRTFLLPLLALFLAACSSGGGPQADETEGGPLPPPTYELALPEGLRALVTKPFTGDFDEMVKRRLIRVAVPYNRTYYFIDQGVQSPFGAI